jgi:hypothetical protein
VEQRRGVDELDGDRARARRRREAVAESARERDTRRPQVLAAKVEQARSARTQRSSSPSRVARSRAPREELIPANRSSTDAWCCLSAATLIVLLSMSPKRSEILEKSLRTQGPSARSI